MVLKARVEHGKIVANAPEGYPDGAEIEIEIVDLLGMDPEERAALDAELEAADLEVEQGLAMPARQFLASLRARRA